MSNLQLQQKIHDLARAVGAEIKKTKGQITESVGAVNDKIGTPTELQTSAKTNLVNAINEVVAKISTVEEKATAGASVIDDAQTVDNKTWSSQKIDSKISEAISSGKAELKEEILGSGVDRALDTLKELGEKIKEGGTSLEALTAKIDKAVVYDRQQDLSEEEQGNVLRALGFTDTNYVETFNNALA